MSLSNYPNQLDNDTNLYLVHDGLRVRLAEDYTPGDTVITVNKDPRPTFPPTGIITLTEQCSSLENRALSFEYTGMTANSFTGLTLLPDFTDVPKPKRLTDVTMNVTAPHHDALKDALINIEHMAGRRGEIAKTPLTGTMEARINYLRNLILKPKAWFGVNSNVGVIPMTVKMQDLTVRAPTTYHWDFGDGNTQDLSFPYVPGQAEGTSGTAPDGSVEHTYTTPGQYSVSLTVTNPFGTNSVTIADIITARTEAPDPATIEFAQGPTQTLNNGVLRSRVNLPIDVTVSNNGEQALDPITTYTWSLSDDLVHQNLPNTEAQYGVGGQYDVRLRVDTHLGAYRITTFPQVIDVVERTNLWFSIFNSSSAAVTKSVSTYEFGLLSEVFKTRTLNTFSITRDYTFLNSAVNSERQIREFRRNNGFTPRTMIASGDQGSGIMYWQESQDTMRVAEFNGFTDTYTTPQIGGDNSIGRTWNWVSLNSPQTVYFLFGDQDPAIDLTNPTVQELDLANLTLSSNLLNVNNFENGAEELLTNVGDGTDGEFSVYRSCWKDNTGYIVRNDGTGSFFRLKSFYRTEGVLSDPVKLFRKIPDLPGGVSASKTEGQLVALVGGIYFFNNSGEVSVYNPVTNVWQTYGAGVGSPAFSSLQDQSVTGFDSLSNTLLATGDGDRTAFLSFDYSNKTFLKFNEVDATFTKLPDRPLGEQFCMSVF